MTSYARIQSIAEKHANETCTHAYERHGEAGVRRCLLGWMAADSGIRLPGETYNAHALGMNGTGRFNREMQSEFGLSPEQLKQLQRANDESKSPAHLMDLVTSLLGTWSAEPVPSGENGPRPLIDEPCHAATHGAASIAPPG